jgi:hypothetical protein
MKKAITATSVAALAVSATVPAALWAFGSYRVYKAVIMVMDLEKRGWAKPEITGAITDLAIRGPKKVKMSMRIPEPRKLYEN